MNRHPLHRGGFPPISDASIGKALKDGRAYRQVSPPPRSLIDEVAREDAWLNARRARIEPRIGWGQVAVMALVAAFIGAMLAIGAM